MTLNDTQQTRSVGDTAKPSVFVDGASGTTGLGIQERLHQQGDVVVTRHPGGAPQPADALRVERLAVDGALLIPAHLLYLATRAGAVALGMDEEIGDFSPGKSADLVYLRPPQGSPLEAVVKQADSMDRILAALFTMAGSESVREVRVEGSVVFRAPEV